MPEAAPVAPVTAKAPVTNGKAPVVPTRPTPQAIAKGMPPSTTEKAPVEAVVDDDPVIWEGTVDGKPHKVKKSEGDRYFSKGAYADKLIRQAKEALKATQATEASRATEKERLRKETEAVLRESDIDPEAFARSILERKVREGQMTPEQRDLAQAKAEIAEMKAKLDGTAKTEQQKQQSVAEEQLAKRIDADLAKAADKLGLKRDDEAFYAMYEVLDEAHRLGLPWDPDRIAEMAQEKITGAQSRLETAVLKGLTGEALLARLGPKVTDAVLAAKLEQLRNAKRPGGAPVKAPVAVVPPPKPSQYITNAEAEERFRQLRRK